MESGFLTLIPTMGSSLMRYFTDLWNRILGSIRDNCRAESSVSARGKLQLRCEPLEKRDMLSILTWKGGDGTWSTDPTKKNWTDEYYIESAFEDGDEVIFPAVVLPDDLAVNISPYDDGTAIHMAVRPSKITFQVDGYQITGDPGCSITASGAFASQLPIYVEQTGANPEIEATISAPIKDFGGGSTTGRMWRAGCWRRRRGGHCRTMRRRTRRTTTST
jgi:hypothetical protein